MSGRRFGSSDYISVYDGNGTSATELRTFRAYRSTENVPAVFVSSGNVMTVKFRAQSLYTDREKMHRFKAVYTTTTSGKFDYTNDLAIFPCMLAHAHCKK